ncbi:putative mfs multidrug transporter protein [Botrytis fragariae]|uniref:Putative mfs multidrug transporter protein n=1 Tax=Botrytis fragariae TaxID=1964551 RepID=A0A8H6EJ63_9HELO|nr:putative mfs multidrug transporter protein [Botrytis fragariae]KAF5874199.1 putative mfs multidrug transporter protein [Botrytis fragariae]
MSPAKVSGKEDREISNPHSNLTSSSDDIGISKSAQAISSKKEEIASPECAPKSEDIYLEKVDKVDRGNGEGDGGEDKEEIYEYISGYKILVVMAAITLTTFLALLDTTIVATAIPRITSHFHSLPDVGWYGSAYLITNCSLQPLSGKLYTYFRSKTVFLSFFFLFEFGSLLCGTAVSSDMLIVGRAVAGMGSAGLMNGAITILTHAVPIEKRPVYLGFMISTAQLALAVGPLIGGALTQYASWRWCFYINLPCGFLVSLLLFSITIPERLHPTALTLTPLQRIQHLDLLGFFLFAPTAIQFLLALEWGGTTYPWSSSHIIGLFIGSFFTFLLFLYREYRAGDEAMIPLSLVRNTVVWTCCCTNFLFMAGMLTLSYYLPIYFQGVRGVQPTMSGVYTLPGILSQMLFAIISGFAVQKIGYYLPFSIVGGCFAAIGYGLISTYTPSTPASKWIGYQILGGIGRGLSMQMVIIAIQNNLTGTKIVIAQTLVIFFQYLGGALCLTFASTIFTAKLKSGLRVYAPSVDPQIVIEAGATAYRNVIPKDQVMNVVTAYNLAINHCFYLAAGMAAGVMLFVWGMGWKKIGGKDDGKNVKAGQEGGAEA